MSFLTIRHYAFLLARDSGIVFCADLLTNAGGEGLAFVPSEDQDEPARARETVRKLLDLNFEILCTNHGDPVIRGAKQAIREALERDQPSDGS